MLKIGVMGDKDSIYGFAGIGIATLEVEDPAAGIKLLREIADDYAVIYITEALAGEMASEIAKYDDRPSPAIVPIPGITGNTGLGLRNVSRSVAQAVGSDILPD